MDIHNHNLNIHYSVPQHYWNQLAELYKKMPNWNGYQNNIPIWYGTDERIIDVSVEPSGLSFYAKLPQKEWEQWFSLFKQEATKIMGYQVGEPEEGFDFVYF